MITIGHNVLNVFAGENNNSIMAQLGDILGEETESQAAQWIQHTGFASKPPLPVPGKTSCETVLVHDTQRDAVIGSRDVASQVIYGNLGAGEACQYAAGPDGTAQARVITKADGSVILYTTDTNAPGGNGVYFRVAPDRLEFVAPWGKFIFDASGFHIKTQTGAAFDLGSLNFPALPQMSSYARITAGNVTLDSSTVMLGPSAGLYQSSVYSITPPPSPGTPLPMFTTAGSGSVFIGI